MEPLENPYEDEEGQQEYANDEVIHSDMIDQIHTSQMQIVNAPTLIEMSFQDGKSEQQENQMYK